MSLKRKLVSLAVAAGAIGGLAPIGGPAAANCEPTVLVFFRTGVFLPPDVAQATGRYAVGNPTYESGQWGCIVGSAAGVGIDSNYVYPGSTMTLGSLYAATGETLQGCINSPEGIVNWCGTWQPTAQTLPDSPHYTDSPWIATDPTVPSGRVVGNGAHHGNSNTYRTIDRL